MVSTTKLKEQIANGKMVETREEMNDEYLEMLKQTLIIVHDTELVSVCALFEGLEHAPTLNAKLSLLAIMQDELGHTHIAARLLNDLGVDIDELLYERDPHDFKHPYAFDFSIGGNWAELACANIFFDRAGYSLLGDASKNTSYAPWKRALKKVDVEEVFHIRNGEFWVKEFMKEEETRKQLQAAANWMFPMAVEFFGLPDELKKRNAQVEYRIKGKTNNELRQDWLSKAVPFCESVGLKVPAHFDEEKNEYVLEYPFPCKFDEKNKRWLFDQPCTWDEVLQRFKNRGTKCEEFVQWLRTGHQEFKELGVV